ncbi:unnamed protein product, partial [Effrenium voratum]
YLSDARGFRADTRDKVLEARKVKGQRPAEWDPGALTTMSLGAQLARGGP